MKKFKQYYENLIEANAKAVYFCWDHDHPQTVEVKTTSCKGMNCEKIKESGYIVFSWNDEKGYVFARGKTKEDVYGSFRMNYLEWFKDDDEELEQAKKESSKNLQKFVEKFIKQSEVDKDSGYAYALIDMNNLPKGFKQGTV